MTESSYPWPARPIGSLSVVPDALNVERRIEVLQRAYVVLVTRHENADWVRVDEVCQAMADLRAAHPTPLTDLAESYARELLAEQEVPPCGTWL